MKTFVMGDLHGNWVGLCQCLKKCDFNYQADTLIQLGDVVDGGNQEFECVEELLKIRNLIAIKGNYDAWFDEYIKSGYHPGLWAFGGDYTVKSYSYHAGKKPIIIRSAKGLKVSLNPSDIPIGHQQFFDRQRLFYIDGQNNCFVHAGFDRFIPFEQQKPEKYYWDRQLWEEALQWQIRQRYYGEQEPFNIATKFNNIFLGHTSTLHWKLQTPLKAANIYNLDTGSGKVGRLTIMDVQSKEFWQSDERINENI